MKKIYLDRKRLTIKFLIAMLTIYVVLFLAFLNIFIFQTWNFVQPVIIGMLVLFGIVSYIMTLKYNYYILTNSSVVVRKYSKEIEYSFSDIIYIDKERSEKKKTVILYGNKCHERYLPFDKDEIVYKALLKGCKNLLTTEEFRRRFPDVIL